MSLRDVLRATALPATPLAAPPLLPQEGWQRCWRFAADSPVFAGHFPGNPVLPAVVQCLMAQMLVEDALGQPLQLLAVVQAKFTRVTGPDENIMVRVRPARKAGQWDCTLHVDAPAADTAPDAASAHDAPAGPAAPSASPLTAQIRLELAPCTPNPEKP